MLRRRILLLATAIAAPLALTAVFLQARGGDPRGDQPVAVVRSYLQATYAREFRKAYDLLSSADRKVRDKNSYVGAQGELTGFSLEVARKLADFMTLEVIQQSVSGEQGTIKIGYAVPAPEEVSSLVLHWDAEKLNSLAPKQRQELLDELDARKNAGRLVMLQGQETLQLVREGKAWKISQDWAAGVKIQIRSSVPREAQIDVKLLQNEVITKGEEPFQVHLKIKNRGSEAVAVTLRHLLEPAKAAEDLEMIECGLLRPVTLRPGVEQEFSMAYLLSEAARKQFRKLSLTYAFEVNK